LRGASKYLEKKADADFGAPVPVTGLKLPIYFQVTPFNHCAADATFS
jgi:hypothetical protein